MSTTANLVMEMASSPATLPHIAVFPFMSKGHIIPLTHLAHLLHRRCLATLTFFTTPLNAPFLRDALAGSEAAIVELPFPQNITHLPPGVESTDQLPSMSLFLPFVHALELLRPHFEQILPSLQPAIDLLISDPFLVWTNRSASKFGIPRLAFCGSAMFPLVMKTLVLREKPHAGLGGDHRRSFGVPGFPHLRLTIADLSAPFDDPNPQGPVIEFDTEFTEAIKQSQGLVVNSFYGLEADYIDHWNNYLGPKARCIGPLCLVRFDSEPARPGPLIEWLDSRLAANRPVLYVAFGTQAELSESQLREIAAGLDRSRLDFLWVVHSKGAADLGDGFEERVGERGKVVREWVHQLEILRHGSVQGFVSHCGWNSVSESICAGVPMLAWPMMAEQQFNAKLLVDELRIGLRVRASDGSRDGLVRREDLVKMARELMLGEKGKEAAKNVKVLAKAAAKAMDGGSSWQALEQMIDEFCGDKNGLAKPVTTRGSRSCNP